MGREPSFRGAVGAGPVTGTGLGVAAPAFLIT
jgi:hypothetical protein